MAKCVIQVISVLNLLISDTSPMVPFRHYHVNTLILGFKVTSIASERKFLPLTVMLI
jgi:hypothetical protein